MDKPRFMKQMDDSWPSLLRNQNAIRLQPFRLHFSIDCSFQLQPSIIPVPVEIEIHTVPHFKATINTKVEPEQLGCDGIFISY